MKHFGKGLMICSAVKIVGFPGAIVSCNSELMCVIYCGWKF